MNRKATLVLSNMVIALVVFSFTIMGFWAAYATMAPQYGLSVNTSFVQAFDTMNQTKVLSQQLSNNVENTQASTTTTFITFVSSGVSGLQIMFQSVSIVKNLAFELSAFFGIPEVIFILFVTVLFIAVTAAIVAALLRAPEI